MSFMSDFAERRKRVREQMDELAKQRKEMRASLRPEEPVKEEPAKKTGEEKKKPPSRIQILRAKVTKIEKEFEAVEKAIRKKMAVNPYEEHSVEEVLLERLAVERFRRLMEVLFEGRKVVQPDDGVSSCGPQDIFHGGDVEDAEWEYKDEGDDILDDLEERRQRQREIDSQRGGYRGRRRRGHGRY